MPKEIHFYIPPIHDKFVSFTPPPNFISSINRITDGPCKRVWFSAQISFIYSVWFCMINLLRVAISLKKIKNPKLKVQQIGTSLKKKKQKCILNYWCWYILKGICSREPVSKWIHTFLCHHWCLVVYDFCRPRVWFWGDTLLKTWSKWCNIRS